MTQRKRPEGPKVEVVRRVVVTPKPLARPAPSGVPSSPTGAAAPAPQPLHREPQSDGPSGAPPRTGRSGPPFSRPRGPPRPPPSTEEVNALARKERVPARIAKGDLEGKMKCRIWRKLHAEEARRFDQAYTLMEKHPELDLADAFGVLQSGRTPAEFLAKKARGQLKEEIKSARAAVPNEAIDRFFERAVQDKLELSIVLADRTVLDVLKEVQPVALMLERSGRMEKLNVVLIAGREVWDSLSPHLQRNPKLAKKPAGVPKQPDRRPVADPRPLLPHIGQQVRLELRNGIHLDLPLLSAGAFDLLVGEPGKELLVPLHALLSWSPA